MSGSVPVVLVGVVIAAARSEKQAGQGKQHNARKKHGAKVEAGEGGVHKIF